MSKEKKIRIILSACVLVAVIAAALFLFVIDRQTDKNQPNLEENIGSQTVAEHEHDWEDGHCSICGIACQHEYSGGVCRICGMSCPHTRWEHGVCADCGLLCSHEKHNAKTLLCSECGEKQHHAMLNGKCSSCNYVPEFYEDWLPERFYEPCEEQGKILTLNYGATYYAMHMSTVKTAKIYVPYNYDDSDIETKYNVVFFIHGLGGEPTNLIDDVFTADGKQICMRNIYDHMIAEGLCEPFIAVGVDTYITVDEEEDDVDTGYAQVARELREVVVPYIASHFNTYAESDRLEDIVAARQHFALAGLSNGSLYTLHSGFLRNFDIFGNYAAFSGNNCYEEVLKTITSEENQQYPIFCFFAGAGTREGQQKFSSLGFHTIVDGCDRLSEGKNAFYVSVEAGHDWKTWSTDLYNSLLVMFQDVS